MIQRPAPVFKIDSAFPFQPALDRLFVGVGEHHRHRQRQQEAADGIGPLPGGFRVKPGRLGYGRDDLPLLQVYGQVLVPDVELVGEHGQPAHQPVAQQETDGRQRKARADGKHRQGDADAEPAAELPQADVLDAVFRRLAPHQPQVQPRPQAEEDGKEQLFRAGLALQPPPEQHDGAGRDEAQQVDIQKGRQLVDQQRGILKAGHVIPVAEGDRQHPRAGFQD